MTLFGYLRTRKRIRELNEVISEDPDFVTRAYSSLTHQVCAKRCKHFEALKKEARMNGFSVNYDRIYDAFCKNCVIMQLVNIKEQNETEAE